MEYYILQGAMVFLLGFFSYVLFGIVGASAVGAGIMAYKFWRHMEHIYPLQKIGIFRRITDDATRRDSMEPDNSHKEYVDVIRELWKFPNHNIFVTGISGLSGKSTVLEALLNDVTDPVESKKYFNKPLPAVIFSPKRFDEGDTIDFELGGRFRFVDCKKEMINVFSDIEAFVASWEVLTSNITSKGIMASHIAELAGTICKVSEKPCQSWAEFKRNLEILRKKRDNTFNNSELDYIADKIQYLDVEATVTDIPASNCIFYIGSLPRKARSFYYEAFLQKLAKELEGNRREKPLLVLDELHLLTKNQVSIVSTYLRELRTHIAGLWCASQNVDDCDPQILQFAKIFCGITGHLEPFENKPTFKECVGKLKERQFIEFMSAGTNDIPIYSVSDKIIEKLKDLKTKEKSETENVVVAPEPDLTIVTQPDIISQVNTTQQNATQQVQITQKIDKKELEEKILALLQDRCAYITEISKNVSKNTNAERLVVNSVVQRLVKEKKIRVIKYVTEKKNIDPRKIYFTNEQRAETSVHKQGVEDIQTICKKEGFAILNTYQHNQGWDVELSNCFGDFKTGLERNLKNDLAKLQASTKKVIFCCVNHEVAYSYQNSLEVIEGIEGKFVVCALDTLAEEIRKIGN